MWGIYFPANQIVIIMLIIMAHWLWLRCQKPRPPGALTFCLQRASNQKNHTFKQNEMNREGSTYYWYGFFLQGFLHFSPRFTSMLCKCTNWTIEFCCIVIFFCVSCVTTVSKLRSEETAEIKTRQHSEQQILVMKSLEESSILSEFLKQHTDSYSFTRCSPPTSLCFICMGVGLPHLIDSKTLLLTTQQLGKKRWSLHFL